MYLLDTNAMSDLIRHPQGPVGRRVSTLDVADVATSVVVAAELRYGAELRQSTRLTVQMEEALARLPVLPLGVPADACYGHLRATLKRRGLPIGANDMLIAAHALALDATLVTDNVREFERVDGLRIENWLRGD